MDEAILHIEDLHAHYLDGEKTIKAVGGVSLSLRRGVTLALTGESGCGKTTVALAVLGLIPFPGRVVGGRVLFDGQDLLALGKEDMRQIRGRQISMIFQDPVSGLNPVLTVGEQVEEIIISHLSVSKKEARAMSLEALQRMGLSEPQKIAGQYPFHLSGGMCQRAMIAMATVLNPKVVIADEPTASLDVTIQAAILNELDALKRERDVAIMLITHDLGVVAQMADEVAVMYAGRIVERGSASDVYGRPLHPYTWALLSTRPRLDGSSRPLPAIKGTPPDLGELPDECAFLPRCRKALSACRTDPTPPLREMAPAHWAACFNPVYHHED
jgi:oligopeptide/dipeptide ABC transporter ATP-binding protein